MNCLWLVWFMPPKPDTVPVKALTLLGESLIASPPLPPARKAMLAVPPTSTSTTPLPTTTAPPLTTAPLVISTRLPGPLAIERAGIGQRAAADDGAAVQGFDQRAGADRRAAQGQRCAAQNLQSDAGIDVADRDGGVRTHFQRGSGERLDVRSGVGAEELEGAAAGDGQRTAAAVAADGAAVLDDGEGAGRDRAAERRAAREDNEGDAFADLRAAEEGAGAEFVGGAAQELEPVVAGVGADELDSAAACHRRRPAEHAAELDDREPAGLDRRPGGGSTGLDDLHTGKDRGATGRGRRRPACRRKGARRRRCRGRSRCRR